MKGLQCHAKELVRSGVRSSTARTYSSGQRRYLDFCSRFDQMALPADEETLLIYVAFLHLCKLTVGTIRVYLSAVRSLHIEEGLGNPLEGTHRISRALRSITISGSCPKQKLPITLDLMEGLLDQIPRTYDGCVLWAAMTLGFFGCLRASEFCVVKGLFSQGVNVCFADVSIVTETKTLKVFIKKSKTDKKNRGFTLHIGCSGHAVCAFCIIDAMLRWRAAIGLSLHPASPLFLFSSGLHLTKSTFVNQTRLYLGAFVPHPEEYSGHSYRAGSATTAALSGLSDWEIQLLGRWTSTAYLRYIRAPTEILTNFSRRMTQVSDMSTLLQQKNAFVSNVI